MNSTIQQIKSLLSEEGTLNTDKRDVVMTALDNASNNIDTEFNKAKERRDKATAEKRDLDSMLNKTLSALGIDSESELDSRVEELKNGNIELSKIEERHQEETAKLRQVIQEAEAKEAKLIEQHEQMAFDSSITNLGILERLDESVQSWEVDLIKQRVKDGLIYENGQIFVRDGDAIAKDIKTGEVEKPEAYVEKLFSTGTFDRYIPTKVKEGGASTSSNAPSSTTDMSKMNDTERVKLFRQNPEMFK